MSEIYVRRECPDDYPVIESLVREAFAAAEHSDGGEHELIDRIRHSGDYIPELSLVAVCDGVIVGYIMFSRISVGEEVAVAPAPLAVRIGYQRRGVGKLLVTVGHDIARRLGYPCAVILGSPDYYVRFGYQRASLYGIRPPFDVDDRYYMVCVLNQSRSLPAGIVRYSDAFGL